MKDFLRRTLVLVFPLMGVLGSARGFSQGTFTERQRDFYQNLSALESRARFLANGIMDQPKGAICFELGAIDQMKVEFQRSFWAAHEEMGARAEAFREAIMPSMNRLLELTSKATGFCKEGGEGGANPAGPRKPEAVALQKVLREVEPQAAQIKGVTLKNWSP